jgi:hypothetical protein
MNSRGTTHGERPRVVAASCAVPEVDLAFIARRLERLVDDAAGLKDDMTVVIARLDRLDATTHSLVTEVRAMHSRHDRVAKRVERLEDTNRDVPS